ncbi:MAG: hypothetical protein HC906_11165 [Bacteroidales bacterium]|nr:hypothetical protein [Bacteroidales bacterium]
MGFLFNPVFSIWLADLWITPFGPYWNNIYWFPPLMVGILVALILAAATPSVTRVDELLKKTGAKM